MVHRVRLLLGCLVRDLVIVDVESTGLRRNYDFAVEVAWKNVDTGDKGLFVPNHSIAWVLHYAEPKALEINQYRERLISAKHDDGTEVRRLHAALVGNSFGGSNPRADADWLAVLFAGYGLDPEPQHYRFPDLASFAAGVLAINPRDMPGLFGISERLKVKPGDHSAMGDVEATAECFRRLIRIQQLVEDGVALSVAKSYVCG